MRLICKLLFINVTLLIIVASLNILILACNESVCASIVSKCMLTQSCNCDLKVNTSCYKSCYVCLDFLYTECCSCVEMCPKPTESDTLISSKSHVEDFTEPLPQLFSSLTDTKDSFQQWTAFTFPVKFSVITSIGTDPKEIKFGSGSKVTMKTDGLDQEEDIQVNCTVAYMMQCMSWNKCKSACRSMGSSSYRWFHDGCCECVGHNCVNYGLKESRCSECPLDAEVTNSFDETESHNKDKGKEKKKSKSKNDEEKDDLNTLKKTSDDKTEKKT